MTARPAAFLDRDGVLNIDDGYTFKPESLRFVDGAPDAVRRLNRAGYLVIVVTNQSGVARGLYSEAQMHGFNDHLQAGLLREDAHLDAVYTCPYHPDGSVAAYRRDHPDRKPKPGMILRAFADLDIDRARSFLIGDKTTDIEAASAAGIPGYLFASHNLDDFVADVLLAEAGLAEARRIERGPIDARQG